jgi:hypothetical protein
MGVGIVAVGRDNIRIHLIRLPELLLRSDAHPLGFLLLFVGAHAQPFGLDLGLLGISLGACCFGLAVTRAELVGLRFLAHLHRPVPVGIRLALAVEEQYRRNDRRHYYDANDDPDELS